MIKIGIVSRIHGINYGANLQAYALLTALKKLGFDPYYINYTVKIKTRGVRRILSFGYSLSRFLLGYKKRLDRTKNFQRKLDLSLPIKKNFKDAYSQFDILLAGSDQIWNPRYYVPSNGLYLFEGEKVKPKFSYASSFGVRSIDENYSPVIFKCLSQFKSLSCRENGGVDILNKLGLTAKRHIDPTFLLSKDEWLRMFDYAPIIKGKYICCYVMPGVKKLNNKILHFAEHLKKQYTDVEKIVVIGDKEYVGLLSNHVFVRDAGPIEFLNIIYNSEIVLTSSFHGTCFSIIFQKQFASIIERSNKFNSRIEDLLSNLDLSSQMILVDNQTEEFNVAITRPDYEKVNRLLEKERENSYDYLASLKKYSSNI